MTRDTVIKVKDVWKRYGLPFMPRWRQAIDKIRNQEKSIDAYGPWSLRGLDFEIYRGETLGIIGHNGAGKSTLLKILAGVTPATDGDIQVNGRIFPMIELNAGLHNELTGRQNTYMLGAVMGLSRNEVNDRIEQIKNFSELEEWFERPVRKYSSGMLTRLGFSVAIHVDADILLIDEVLSVGDITFQRKCFDHMERLQSDENTTMIFVSHSIRQVERLCERTLMLDAGEQVAYGKTGEVIDEYYKRSNTNIIKHRVNDGKTVIGRYAEDPLITIDAINLLDGDNNPSDQFVTGQPLCVEILYSTPKTYDDVIVGVGIATVDSFYIAGMSSEFDHIITVTGKGSIRCYIDSLPLMSGVYMINVKLRNNWGVTYGGGFALRSFSITVESDKRLSSDYGVVGIDTHWESKILDANPSDHKVLKEVE